MGTFHHVEGEKSIREYILAAGALDYVYVLGELLGVFKLADALVLRWTAGVFDVRDPATKSRLNRHWQLSDDRLSAKDRGMLYRRVLAKGNTEVLSGMVVNDAFPNLWRQLMSRVADYIRETQGAGQNTVSKVPIELATRDLQLNLTEHMSRVALMQVTDLHAQLHESFDVLGAPEIAREVGAGRQGGVWATIERLWLTEGEAAPDTASLRTLAVEGNQIFRWIADYSGATPAAADFDRFRESAEAWTIAASAIGEGPPP